MKHKQTAKILSTLLLAVVVAQPALAVTASQAATADGRKLSNNHCTGTAKPQLTALPMRLAGFGFIIPYGVMVGGHVTPIDHQYYSPIIFDSPTGAYNVYAMADSHIVDIGTRTHKGQGQNANRTVTDYRLVFSVSCHLLYYYDLVNSLSPSIKKTYDAFKKPHSGQSLNIPVKSGQLIGKIGGQTLDFAVWDMETRLAGFINPAHYTAEAWKIHTADPLNYVSPKVKTQMLSKYIRTTKPISGKIDYDIDGRLSGTWFQRGTNGYAGKISHGQSGYWSGHLVFAPNWWDPTKYIISIGNWTPDASQFAILGNTPKPKTVSQATGLVKYDLVQFRDYVASSDTPWDDMTWPNSSIVLHPLSDIQGCLLAQMTGRRTMKAQKFQGTACSNVAGFTSAAINYER